MKRILLILALLCALSGAALSHMGPSLALQDRVNGNWFNSESSSQDNYFFLGIFNLSHHLLVKFCHAVFTSLVVMVVLASFSFAILNIINASSKEQMVGIYALGIVTFVKHQGALRHSTKMYVPRCNVRPYIFPSTNSNNAVSISPFSLKGANPEPTILRFINEFPESFREWDWLKTSSKSAIALMTAIFSAGVIGGNEIALAH